MPATQHKTWLASHHDAIGCSAGCSAGRVVVVFWVLWFACGTILVVTLYAA